ncbi:MAG TPA: helicase C-terminal domain-containing protein [Candidatus Acidoferrales bacterium]|nr:helicase C-terminal domain-containing protein [Candidatus Acidoferrales bacterium]
MDLVALDLETTGFDPERDRIIEIGAVRVRLAPDGGVTTGETFSTLVDPGGDLPYQITRLTGIRDEDLAAAPPLELALARFDAFAMNAAVLGHNVAFDLAFLERAGLGPRESLDTVELASILQPTAPTYALQALAAAADVHPEAAHRGLADSLTCAALLADLARRARELSPVVLAELQAYAPLLGPAYVTFFAEAAADALRSAWVEPAAPKPAVRRVAPPAAVTVGAAFAGDGPLARSLAGYEERTQQRTLAAAIERAFAEGGALVAEAGTGVGKSLAYLVPSLGRAMSGERVIVSTHTLPLQDQLVRKDLPALQDALGTNVLVTVLKGRSNYLCPRRWQQFRGLAATREEARLAMKTLVWRQTTTTGDRAELNLLGPESELWSRVSADDETCDGRRCARVPGGCYLQRAREAAAKSGLVVTNHALLLQDARMRGALLPPSEHLVVDEAHRLEEVATDAFGLSLEDALVRRTFDRIARAPAVIAGLKDDRVDAAEDVRREVGQARERANELFAALGAVVDPVADSDRLRVTTGLRGSDERWLPVELAGERFSDAVAGIATAAERLATRTTDEDDQAELQSAAAELNGIRIAVDRGIHAPRQHDVVWLERGSDGAVALRVAPSHLGVALRRGLVEPRRSVVYTSATLAVGTSFHYALDRFGISDIADARAFGSPFDYASQAILVVPTEGALPSDPSFADEAAETIAEIGRALDGRTLVLFTAHGSMREVASRLAPLEESGVAVLTQGIDGSRRSLLERFAAGRAVLLGTQSFWEGIDLPGEMLECVVIARLPFLVPDDPLVQGRSERYEDPFREFHLPQAALRLRQGFGRLIRTRTDRGAVVLLDRRALLRDYGAELLGALPDARVRRVPPEAIAATVAEFCGR